MRTVRTSLACVLTLAATISGAVGQGVPAVGAAGRCTSSVARPIASGFPEVSGPATTGKLWALLFYRPPAAVGVTEKIVLRARGSGPLRVRAIGLSGTSVRPTWGPERHGGSTWNRPGDEWGTGWTFPTAGCWRLHATRTRYRGDVWLEVHPGP